MFPTPAVPVMIGAATGARPCTVVVGTLCADQDNGLSVNNSALINACRGKLCLIFFIFLPILEVIESPRISYALFRRSNCLLSNATVDSWLLNPCQRFWVVKHLDVIEHIGSDILSCSIDLPIDSLLLQQLKEALSRGIFLTLTASTHAAK